MSADAHGPPEDESGAEPGGPPGTGEELAAPEAGEDERRLASRVRSADSAAPLLRAARALRRLAPGDPELGADPLSTAGRDPSQRIARTVADVAAERPSVARELGLGALQVWQAVSEAQGRGRGQVELTILFTDLVEFSSWSLEAGDEATLALLRRVGVVQEGAIADHGGEVVKRLGDGLMAVFTEPEAAVRAALAAAAEVEGVEAPGYSPALRAGLHLGRPRKLGGDYLGVDVNVAARLAEGAKGGQVLVSGPLCERLDEQRFTRRRVRRFRAKGAPRDLEVFRVEAA